MSHSGQLHAISASDSTVAAAPVSTPSWRAKLRRALAILRRIIGVPDYEAYLAHMQRTAPTCTPMDARTFERERLADKYTRPGSRCC